MRKGTAVGLRRFSVPSAIYKGRVKMQIAHLQKQQRSGMLKTQKEHTAGKEC